MNDALERRRATTMEEMGEKMMAMFGGLAAKSEPFKPLPTDVIITPYGKCGTTWLQQMFHTLRTRGDTDFDDISRVVPWIETSPGLGIDLNAPQRGEPRGFKSHLSWDDVPKGAKYIVSIRDPRDALVSMYRFMEGGFMEPGAIDIDDVARANYLRGPKHYWHHLASWWEHRDDDNVLLLSYEGMKDDPAGAIERVAAFCGIPLDDELRAVTLEHSSLEFMLKHKDKFDDLLMREMSEKAAGLPPGSDSAKVREGRVGSHRQVLSQAVQDEMARIWQDQIESRFGFSDYQAMIATLA